MGKIAQFGCLVVVVIVSVPVVVFVVSRLCGSGIVGGC